MEPHREDTDLATELRELRPAPRPEFVTELDARAGAGFPGADGAEAGPSLSRRLAERLERLPRWRVPALAGSVAVAAIVVATAVVAISENESVTPTAERLAGSPQRLEARPAPPSGSVKPFARQLPRSGEAAAADGAAASPEAMNLEAEAMNFEGAAPQRASGPNAFLASHRDVERSAQIVLATEPSEVRAAAARVFETVRSYDGIVLRSSIAASDGAEARAVFELLIPSGKLGGAMAAFSEIADVRSRRDASSDVTGRTIGLEERLQDGRACIESLLAELASADTEAEREAVERDLRFERGRLAALRSALQNLERRVNLSRVSLRIEGGSASSDGDGGSWGVSDAFDDAGRILAIAAGVTLIGLAVLAPFILLALLAYLFHRFRLKRSLDQVLD